MAVNMLLYNDLDDMTLTSDNTPESTLPLDNVKESSRSKIMRYVGTDINITANSDNGDIDVSGFAIAAHNMSNAATVRVRLYDDVNGTGSVVYDSTALTLGSIPTFQTPNTFGDFLWGGDISVEEGLPNTYHLWFTQQTCRSALIEIDDLGATNIEIGRLFLGEAFTPTYNYNFGSSISWIDKSQHTRTAGGSLKTELRTAYRTFNFALDWLSDTERTDLSRLLQKTGKGGDCLISLDPDETGRFNLEQTMVCRRSVDNKISRRFAGTSKTTLTFEEV